MNVTTAARLGIGLLLIAVLAMALTWRGERNQLVTAISIAAHAADAKGRPITWSASDAIAQVRIMGKAIDDTKLATANAEATDAQRVTRIERGDAKIIQEVSTHVQDQLERTRGALSDSRALAAERLRALAAARADQGGGGDAAGAPAPDAICGAYFAASCDEVLALLAEAEANTVKLLGWQEFWPRLKANHDGSAAQAADQVLPSILGRGEAAEIGGQVGTEPDPDGHAIMLPHAVASAG